MPLTSVGDMRHQLMLSRSNTQLRTELSTLVQELTSGQVADVTAHLGGSQTHLVGLDRELQMLDRFSQANTETGQLLATMQSVLSSVDNHRGSASQALFNVNGASSMAQVSQAGDVSRSAFEGTVSAINTRFADRSMFGGTAVAVPPLADADTMFSAMQATVAGLSTQADIETALDFWFDSPGGGFETIGYQGDDADHISRPTDTNQTISIQVRADDKAIRDTLKAFALGALASDIGLPVDLDIRQSIQQKAAQDLLTSAAPLADVQARLGYIEGQVEEATVRISAQQASYSIARNDLIGADPFETATKLEAVQLQLQTHYTITARLSRLSLTEYLR